MAVFPDVVALDMIQTVFSLEPLRERLVTVGLPAQALELRFARTLRNGFALAASGSYSPLVDVARGTLESLLAEQELPVGSERSDQVMSGFSGLTAHPDVGPSLERLRGQGVRIVAVTNGSAKNTLTLLKNAGLEGYFERVVSIDDVRAWKPRPEVYQHTARVANCDPRQLALIAAHAWDCHGAARVGLATGWVGRTEHRFNPVFGRPDVQGDTLPAVCEALLGLPKVG